MTSVGVMASAVTLPTAVDVLFEPFNNFTDAPWTVTGAPTIVAGRTGTAARAAGTGDRIAYTIPGASEADTVTIGFAWRTNTTSASVRQVVQLWSDTNTAENNRLIYNGTTAQSFSFTKVASVLGTTATGLVPVNTWAYIEVQTRLHDSAGTVIVRINGVERLNLTGLNTRASAKTTHDTIRITTNVSGLNSNWDDLYVTTGAGAAFKGDITV